MHPTLPFMFLLRRFPEAVQCPFHQSIIIVDSRSSLRPLLQHFGKDWPFVGKLANSRVKVSAVFEKLAQSEVSSGSPAPTSSGHVPVFSVGDDAQKTVRVEAEMQRMKRHPSGSAYATNRMKVLDKMLQLLGKVRTNTEGEELELLFANLNF